MGPSLRHPGDTLGHPGDTLGTPCVHPAVTPVYPCHTARPRVSLLSLSEGSWKRSSVLGAGHPRCPTPATLTVSSPVGLREERPFARCFLSVLNIIKYKQEGQPGFPPNFREKTKRLKDTSGLSENFSKLYKIYFSLFPGCYNEAITPSSSCCPGVTTRQ